MYKLFTVWPALALFVIIIAFEQRGYNLHYGRVEVAYYDKSLVKDAYFFFGRYNRTNYCLNTSFTLLKDLEGNEIKSTTALYQQLNGQYRPIGMEYNYNVCESYKRNLFGFQTQFKKFSNINPCNITKGHYFVKDYMPDESYFPKFAPLGHFMIQMNVVKIDGNPLLTLQWFVESTFHIPNRKFRG